MEHNRRHSIYSLEENEELKNEVDTFILVYWLLQKTLPKHMGWELSEAQMSQIIWGFADKYYDDDAAMDAYDAIEAYLADADIVTICEEEDYE